MTTILKILLNPTERMMAHTVVHAPPYLLHAGGIEAENERLSTNHTNYNKSFQYVTVP